MDRYGQSWKTVGNDDKRQASDGGAGSGGYENGGPCGCRCDVSSDSYIGISQSVSVCRMGRATSGVAERGATRASDGVLWIADILNRAKHWNITVPKGGWPRLPSERILGDMHHHVT